LSTSQNAIPVELADQDYRICWITEWQRYIRCWMW